MTPQWEQALVKAEENRLDRFAIAREVKALSREDGMRAAAAAISRRPSCLATARAAEVIGWARHCTTTLAERLCEECGISPYRVVGQLTDRQAALLVEAVDGYFATFVSRAA